MKLTKNSHKTINNLVNIVIEKPYSYERNNVSTIIEESIIVETRINLFYVLKEVIKQKTLNPKIFNK